MAVGAGMAEAQTPKKGGVLRIGNLGEPPTLDPHWTHRDHHRGPGGPHLRGPLHARRGQPARSRCWPRATTVSPDGLVYTIKLRQGVHVPQRQGDDLGGRRRLARRAGASSPSTARRSSPRSPTCKAVDKYTVEMKLKEKSAIVLDLAGRAEQLRRDLPEGDRREVPARREDHGVRGHRARSSSPSGSPTSTSGWCGSTSTSPGSEQAERLRRRQDRVRGRDPLDPGARRGQPRRRRWRSGELDFADDLDADAYDRLRRAPNVRPDHRQAVLLARRRLQQEGRAS